YKSPRDVLIARKLFVAPGIVGTVARHVDGPARRFVGRMVQLLGRKFDPAADRSAIGERARQLEQLVAELARRSEVVNQAPVNDELLRAEAGPFDKAHGNALVRPRFDGIE